jgi:hypothetical protein
MIYNRLAGLDLGAAPTYLIPANIQTADAPTRYPFLWNAPRQDYSQWTGFAENGNDFLALARNLGQLYGVFGRFHPQPTDSSVAMLDHNYLVDNSANFAGLGEVEQLVKRIAPPVWPWPVDKALAKRGEAIFRRPVEQGGCAACHGPNKGQPRPPNLDTLATPILDVGTDTRQWQVVLRRVATGTLEGATVPGGNGPLQPTDLALHLLKVAVVGTLVDLQGASARAAMPPTQTPAAQVKTMRDAVAAMPHDQMDRMLKPPTQPATAAPMVNVYEARVLQGIWASAPYLHNGAVPTLADLLKPAAQRPVSFAIGPNYDLAAVGLATDQGPHASTLTTTGCDARASGDSRCGHEYGTRLTAAEKNALLEYLKTL